MREATMVQNFLKVYDLASGQQVNYSKSSVSFSKNTSAQAQADVCQLLGILVANENEKYLGVPTNVGRKKKFLFGYMRDRIKQHLSSWGSRILPRARKEVLLKSAALSMPNYLMSVYLLPKDLCAELERMINSFWWGNGSDEKGIQWKSWERMSVPKMVGGMGFRRLHEFNLALIAKQGWRLLTAPHSLFAKIDKARYYPDSNFLDLGLGSSPSFIQTGVMKVLPLFCQGVIKTIGNGMNIGVFKDPCLLGKRMVL